LNPVRARRIENPERWKWNSYRATAGREKPHPGFTTNWVLRQFSTKKEKAEQEYRQFVKWGIGKESIWVEVKGQTLLGQDGFVDGFIGHLRKHKDVPEIPKSQRYAARPALEKIFKESILRDRARRDRAIREAVERYGYTQRAVADHLGLHFTYVSRILSGR
jgi:putative transposase